MINSIINFGADYYIIIAIIAFIIGVIILAKDIPLKNDYHIMVIIWLVLCMFWFVTLPLLLFFVLIDKIYDWRHRH